jgi:hypothetical protein
MTEYIYKASSPESKFDLLVERVTDDWGFYLHVIDKKTGRNIADHLCNDMTGVYLVANEDFGLNPDDFRPVK